MGNIARPRTSNVPFNEKAAQGYVLSFREKKK